MFNNSSIVALAGNVLWLCLVAENTRPILNLKQMSESTKPTSNEDENGNKSKPLLSTVVFPQVLVKWDTATVDLNRNNGMFKFDNVRLRDCSLHFSETTGEYYVRYRDVNFGSFDVYNCR